MDSHQLPQPVADLKLLEIEAEMSMDGRVLFYSTDAQNLSSQRVAARLGLRPIGWTWNLATGEATTASPRALFAQQSPTQGS
jgi:hypothetical protein